MAPSERGRKRGCPRLLFEALRTINSQRYVCICRIGLIARGPRLIGLDKHFISTFHAHTGGAIKGPYKSESSLMTCEAELHGSVTRMVYSILSLIGTRNDRKSNSTKFSALQSASYRAVTIVILCLHCAAQDAAQGGPLGSRIPMVPDSGHALGRDYPEIRRKTACEPPISLRL